MRFCIENIHAAYVLWFAWKLTAQVDMMDREAPATFWDGVVLLLLNPKAYIIMALMFSQFLSMDGGCKLRMFWQFRLYLRLTTVLLFDLGRCRRR